MAEETIDFTSDYSAKKTEVAPVKQAMLTEERYNDWVGKSNDYCQKYGLPDRVVKKNSYYFYKVMTFLFFILLAVCAFYYFNYVESGKFQTTINQPIDVAPVINSTTNNAYTMSTPISNNVTNQYNQTFPVNVNINLANMNCTNK